MSALMYPIFTLLCTVATVTVMMLWIVPVFAQIYRDLKATLPAPTLFLVSFSQLVANNALLGIGIIAATIGIVRRYYGTPEGKYRIDDVKLRIPLIGMLL